MKNLPNLTQTAIKAFLKDNNKKNLTDGYIKGLQLVKLKNNVVWRFRYKYGKKDSSITLGSYPDITLKTAREISRKYRELLAQSIDPKEYIQKEKEKLLKEQNKKTFEKVVEDFLIIKKEEVSEARFKKNVLRAFYKYAIPIIGGYKKIDEITKNDLIQLITKIPSIKLSNNTKNTNKTYTAKEVFRYVNELFNYAYNMDLIDYNPAYGINPSKILPKEDKTRMKAATKANEIKEVYNKIKSYHNEPASKLMLFQALTALRNVGLYRLKWKYIDLEKRIVTYPAYSYKNNNEPFILPLTDRLIDILKYYQIINSNSIYVFRDENILEESLSNRIISYYKDLKITNHTPHGWRSSFSTIAYENKDKHGFSSDEIEALLSHSIDNKVKKAYLRSDFIEHKLKLLSWWDNYLENL